MTSSTPSTGTTSAAAVASSPSVVAARAASTSLPMAPTPAATAVERSAEEPDSLLVIATTEEVSWEYSSGAVSAFTASSSTSIEDSLFNDLSMATKDLFDESPEATRSCTDVMQSSVKRKKRGVYVLVGLASYLLYMTARHTLCHTCASSACTNRLQGLGRQLGQLRRRLAGATRGQGLNDELLTTSREDALLHRVTTGGHGIRNEGQRGHHAVCVVDVVVAKGTRADQLATPPTTVSLCQLTTPTRCTQTLATALPCREPPACCRRHTWRHPRTAAPGWWPQHGRLPCLSSRGHHRIGHKWSAALPAAACLPQQPAQGPLAASARGQATAAPSVCRHEVLREIVTCGGTAHGTLCSSETHRFRGINGSIGDHSLHQRQHVLLRECRQRSVREGFAQAHKRAQTV